MRVVSAAAAVATLEESSLVDLATAPALPALPGVYAMYSPDGKLQYVGLSRKLNASIGGHKRDLPEVKIWCLVNSRRQDCRIVYW